MPFHALTPVGDRPIQVRPADDRAPPQRPHSQATATPGEGHSRCCMAVERAYAIILSSRCLRRSQSGIAHC